MSAPKPRFFLGKSKNTPVARSSAHTSASNRASPAASGSGTKLAPPPADAPIALDGDTRLAEYSSEGDVCPVCKNDRYLNPKLRLMVSKCYHKMCESCLDRLFSLGPEPCPICGQTIRKNQFQPQIFENLEVQKEVAVRRRTAKIFNKRPEDFPSSADYNDYLESYESLTFSLIHSIGSDLTATEAKIRAYELENRRSIEENEERGAEEREELERRERGEREWRERERKRVVDEIESERKEKEDERRKVMEMLEKGDLDPSAILAASAARTRASGIKRSSARGSSSTPDPSSTSSSAAVDPAFAKLQFLSSLSRPSASASSAASQLPALDPLEDFTLYDACDSLYTFLPLQAYAGDLGTLVKERERGTEGGFVPRETWEKGVRGAVMGLWEKPVGWGGGGMEVDMVGA